MSLQPPLPPVSGGAVPLTRSDVLPLFSSHTRIWKARALIPLLAITVPGIGLYWLITQMETVQDALVIFNVIGAALVIALFYLIYLYSGETENSLRYWLIGLVTWGQVAYLYWPVYALVFRKTLAIAEPSTYHGPLYLRVINYFIAAGLCEELLKAAPILVCLALALYRKPNGSLLDWFALRGPLDGLLMGVAAATVFTMWETLGGYVPNAVREGANVHAGLFSGLLLLIPRVLDGYSGHVGYSGIFGYFIGLAATHPTRAWRLVLVGWLVSAALHGLWDGIDSLVWIFLPGLLTFVLFVSCLLKARHLEAPRLAASGSGSVLIGPNFGPRPANGPIRGGLSALAGLVERSVGVVATPAPAPGLPPSGLALGTARVRYALAPGRPIDFSALFGPDGVPPGFGGVVTSAPDGRIEIRNSGQSGWAVATPDGAVATVPTGGEVRPSPGMRLTLGGAVLDVEAFGG